MTICLTGESHQDDLARMGLPVPALTQYLRAFAAAVPPTVGAIRPIRAASRRPCPRHAFSKNVFSILPKSTPSKGTTE